MLMNCKRKIHEKLVFENAPQNPEAIKGIRAYLLALLSYATMSKRCENEEIKNIIERYIYVDDEKAFKKCRKKWDEEMIIGIDGVQWIPENVGEIVAFTDEINEVLARLDRDEDVGIESYGLFCNMDEFFSAQIYADNEEHCFKVVAVQSVV